VKKAAALLRRKINLYVLRISEKEEVVKVTAGMSARVKLTVGRTAGRLVGREDPTSDTVGLRDNRCLQPDVTQLLNRISRREQYAEAAT